MTKHSVYDAIPTRVSAKLVPVCTKYLDQLNALNLILTAVIKQMHSKHSTGTCKKCQNLQERYNNCSRIMTSDLPLNYIYTD